MSKLLSLNTRQWVAIAVAVVASVFIAALTFGAVTINTNVQLGAGTPGLTLNGDDLYVTGTLEVDGIANLAGVTTHGGNVVSDTDSTDDLGTTTVRWANVFADGFTGNTIRLDGATTVNTLTLTTNLADALSVLDSAGDLMVFDTTTGAQRLTITPPVTITGVVTHGGNVVSDTDSTDSLGLTGTRWLSAFVDTYTGTGLTFDGLTGVNVLTVTDNVADALSIIDSSGDLIVFDTQTGVERVTITPAVTISGALNYKESTETVTTDPVPLAAESGKTFWLSGGTGHAVTIPAASNGVVFRFVVAQTFGTDYVFTAPADTIQGSFIEAGATGDTCAASTTITLEDGAETLGDFFELRSNGTSWFIGAHNFLLATSVTCAG